MPVTVTVSVATIAQRLRDDHGVEVSESTVRRYIATTFTEEPLSSWRSVALRLATSARSF